MNLSQIRGFEPGDAEWGVKLADVRGQVEAKEEVRRVVSIWQSGEAFERAGGKRERGLLFLGAPGTGKTMLAKAIATGFNSPFVSIPGSGFARPSSASTRSSSASSPGRRSGSRASGAASASSSSTRSTPSACAGRRSAAARRHRRLRADRTSSDYLFFGPYGALNPQRRPDPRDAALARAPVRRARAGAPAARPACRRGSGDAQLHVPGRDGRGRRARPQPAARRHGRHRQPAVHASGCFTNSVNTLLDAIYIVPRRIGKVPLRLPPPGPRGEQIYFIGATNVPIDRLDPALIRPGRMGRHVWFRTPTKQDRLDILDLYIGKVAHEPELDTAEAPRRDRADHERLLAGDDRAGLLDGADDRPPRRARRASRWDDLVEAMTTIESGTAIGIEYIASETKAVAIHEAGHAAAGHVFMKGAESTRLSIRMRGGSLGPPPGAREGGAVQPLPLRRDGTARLGARRDGRGARLLRRELERRRRRRPVGDRAGGAGWSARRRWAPSRSTSRRSTTRPRKTRASGCSSASRRSASRS